MVGDLEVIASAGTWKGHRRGLPPASRCRVRSCLCMGFPAHDPPPPPVSPVRVMQWQRPVLGLLEAIEDVDMWAGVG